MNVLDPRRARRWRACVPLALCLALAGRADAQLPAQDHPTQYSPAEIAAGQRVYGTVCVTCHGPTGTGVSGVDLKRGPIRRAATDEALRALITSGIPTSGMPSFKLEPAELTGIVAFIRAGFDAAPPVSVALGDPVRGQALVEGKGACLTCHRIEDRGTWVAPDLTDVGRVRTPPALLAAVNDPTSVMLPINRPVRAVRQDGTVLNGRRLNEDLYTVQIITDQGRLVSLIKSELREWTVSSTSTMPSYRDRFTPSEIGDVVAYLVSLKGGRP